MSAARAITLVTPGVACRPDGTAGQASLLDAGTQREIMAPTRGAAMFG